MHLLTQSALLRALGWSLLNSLWQMAFLWLVYVFFSHVFRRASAGARHGLAVFLLGAGTAWAGISFFNTFLSADVSQQSYQLGISYFSQAHWAGTAVLAGRQLIDQFLPYCSTLYLLTLLFLFVRYSQQYLYSRRLLREGLSKAAPELRVFAEQTGRRMGIKKVVNVWLSSLVEGPVTLGSLKPVILLPLAMVSSLTPQQVEALILHELAHIRRHDYLLHLWIAALEVLFFFNPFSRLLIRSIQKEREHRCDDLVLQFRYDPHTYVSALLALARGIRQSPRLALAATGSNDKLLLQRVRRILHLKNTSEPLKGRSLAFLFLTLLMTGMMFLHPVFPVSRTAETPAPAPRTEMAATFISMSLPITNKPELHQAETHPAKKADRSHVHDMEEADDASGDAGQYLVQTDTPPEDKDESDLVGYASAVQVEKRDYSITAEPAEKVEISQQGMGCALQVPTPYVPNSSFSFQQVQDSTTLPGEQYVYLQQMATHQVEQAITQMKRELQIQLKFLEQASVQERPELRQKRQILLEQLKLQEQYLQKQQQLQRKLERVGKKKVIVVI